MDLTTGAKTFFLSFKWTPVDPEPESIELLDGDDLDLLSGDTIDLL